MLVTSRVGGAIHPGKNLAMYLSAITTRRKGLRRVGLGDWTDVFTKSPDQWSFLPSWATAVPTWTPCALTPGSKRPECNPMPQAAPATRPPSDSGTSLFIPNSSVSDILSNMWTGQITDAQRAAVGSNPCIQSIQNMRKLAAAQGTPGPPVGAEQACVTDQEALKKLQLKDPGAINVTALLILLGIVGATYAVTR